MMYLFYKGCEVLERDSKIDLFEDGTIYSHWISSLHELFADKMKIVKSIDDKKMLNTMSHFISQMNFVDEIYLYRYLLLCSFIVSVPHYELSFFLHLISVIDGIPTYKQRFNWILSKTLPTNPKTEEINAYWID